jgi:hypothetical protein
MKRMTILFILLATSISSVTMAAPLEAPFGLAWDMSTASLAELGFTRAASSTGPMESYSSVSVPKAWSVAEVYLALVYHDRLIKVVAIGKDIENDITGTQGKNVYEHVQSILTQEYGQPSFDRHDS